MKSIFMKKHSALQTSTFIPKMAAPDPPTSVHSGLETEGLAEQSPSAPSPFKYMEWMLISGMLLILFAPITGKMMGWPPERDSKENRYLAQPPDVGKTPYSTFPNTVDQYWNDRFAFRTQLIPLRELIWLDLLNAPGKQHVRGIDGHLFFNPDAPVLPGETLPGGRKHTVLDYLGFNRLTAEQLSNWTDYLEGKSAWLRAHGIHYLFVISPNKITVQKRFLPNMIRMGKGKSYLEQLREQVFPNLTPNVDLLDLTPVLIAKEHETGIPMFSRTGEVTHWNGAGFFEGLLAMDERLRRHFPDMLPFPEDKLELQKSGIDPTAYSCRWENDPTVHAVEEPIIAFRSGGWNNPRCSKAVGRKGNLVLFSDSSWKILCGGLESFFPIGHTAFPYQWEHHRHADIYHVTFNELRRMIQEEHPDAVVEAQTERSLMIPPGIGIPVEFRLAARFARGNTIFLLTNNEIDTMFGANVDGITTDGGAFIFKATNDDPVLRTSNSVQIAEDSESIMLIDLDVPVAGIFQVFWSINDMFSENDSIKADIKTGRTNPVASRRRISTAHRPWHNRWQVSHPQNRNPRYTFIDVLISHG